MRLRNFGLAETVELQMKVRAWADARFQPEPDHTITVTEITCNEPGCVPLETLIALFRTGHRPSQFKIFKALEEVTQADVMALGKPGWTMRDEGPGW